MRKLFLVLCFITSITAFAQLENPSRRTFNIGTFVGLGGASMAPIPTLDIRYKGTTLRLAPGYQYNGFGFAQEIGPISKSFYNAYWLFSGYYVRGTQDIHENALTHYQSFSVLGGIKYYMGTRFFSELQFGVEYRTKSTSGFSNSSATSPYFEFGIGVNLFRNFPKKRTIIDEDE
jgi:hypothetical protein